MALLKFKRSATPSKVPTTSDLALGELALNTYDGKVYMKKDDGTQAIVEVGGASGGGTVTSVDVSGGTTGLTFSGGPVTSSGTITQGGTLNVANGGTGATTAAGALTNLGAQAAATALTTSTTFGGDVSGTYNAIVVADDSHNHVISNVDGLQTALDGKVDLSGDTMSGDLIISKADARLKLYDSTGTNGNNPYVEWETTANQGIAMELNVYDSDLPVSGYGLVVREGPSNGQFPTTGTLTFNVLGEMYAGGTSLGSLNKVFHDGYHPNADTLTTARTISLTGDATGSVSFNGSANVSISTTVANDSHTHAFNNLTSKTSGTGTYQTSGDFRAPRFYDSNNTAFYLDPAATSVLNGADFDGIVRIATGSVGPANTTDGLMFDGNYTNGQYRHRFRKRDDSGGIPLYLDYAAGTANSYTELMKFGPNTADGSYLTVYGIISSNANIRAPIFYDSDNTSFYVNPNGTSEFSSLTLSGAQFWKASNGAYQRVDSRVESTNYSRAHWYGVTSTGGTTNFRHAWYNGSSYINVTTDATGVDFAGTLRSTLLYDRDNTAYYINGAGTSILNIVSATSANVDKLKTKNGNYLVISGGESDAYATGQTAEIIYMNSEGGVQINSSPDNWTSGWAGRNTATICDASGNSSLPAALTLGGNLTGTASTGIGKQAYSSLAFMPTVGGGSWRANANATGAIQITMPTTGGADMISFWVDIFDYSSNETFSVYVAGYCYQSIGSNVWVNETALILGARADRNFNIRFGHDGSDACVWIGETDSVWQYPQVTVRDVQAGHSANVADWIDGWSVSLATSFTAVERTIGNAFPASRFDTLINTTSGTATYQTSGSFRAPIFYDSNNTAYYTDPASTSILNGLYLLNSGPTLVLKDSNSTGAAQVGYISFHDSGGVERAYVGYGSSGNTDFYIRNTQGINNLNATYTLATGSMRSPIFYDSNNTNFYVNPDGTTSANFNGDINFGGELNMVSTTAENKYIDHHGDLRFRYSNNSSFFNERLRIAGSSNFTQATGSLRAPIFYDSNNTGRYADLASTGDSIRASGDIVAYYSDDRLKDRGDNIANALDKVQSLNGFHYTANETAQKFGYKANPQVGVSAQEVEAVLPEVVKDAAIGHGYKTVDYAKLVPLLIEAIKELKAEVETLKKG